MWRKCDLSYIGKYITLDIMIYNWEFPSLLNLYHSSVQM